MSKKKLNKASGPEVSRGFEELSKIALPLNDQQKQLVESIHKNSITFVSGPPGSGKTYLAVINGLKYLLEKKFKKLIFSRPCIEAHGENLGFLPGSFEEKMSPYMIPIFDTLSEFMESEEIDKLIKNKTISTLPLAYQRGVNFKDAYVLLDEAQNTSPSQMRMFLTRMSKGSKLVITGDPGQSDVKKKNGNGQEIKNGLVDAIERLSGVTGIGSVVLDSSCIVRHPLIVEIEKRYATYTNGNGS